MKIITQFFMVLAIFCLIFAGEKIEAAVSITVTGSWSEIIDELDLQAGAGSDLIDTYESASDAVRITISDTAGPSDAWRVDVRKVDTKWHSNFILTVKKTSPPVKEVVVEDVDKEFFSRKGDGIYDVQVILGGVSITIPPGTYVTTVIYTVIDT